MTTLDKWSSEEARTTGRGVLNFKPYAAFRMFAVFLWTGTRCETLYDGADETEARKIFER